MALERNYPRSHWRWVWRALIIAMLGIGACLIYMQLRSRKSTEESRLQDSREGDALHGHQPAQAHLSPPTG